MENKKIDDDNLLMQELKELFSRLESKVRGRRIAQGKAIAKGLREKAKAEQTKGDN